MKVKTIKTLMKKDCKSCISNKNILLMLAMPILFCVLYGYVLGDSEGILQMCAIFSISMTPTTVLTMMIAEEKEKNTLRSLMLADVKGWEFLFSKLVVCMALTLIDAIIVFVLAEGEGRLLPVYLIAVFVSTCSLLFLGAVCGLLSKDQTSAGTMGSPLFMLVMIPPLFANMNGTIKKIAVFIPTTSFQTMFNSYVEGESLFGHENVIAMLVCVVWIVAGFCIFNIFYKRKGIDY